MRRLIALAILVVAGCRGAPATLADAARRGTPEDVARLLREDPAALERPDADGLRPLAIAARAGNFNVVEALARRGADLEARSPVTDRTALHEAAAANHVDAISALLNAGANNDALDADRRTPLLLAVSVRANAAANELRFHRSNLATPTPRPVTTRFGEGSTFIDSSKASWTPEKNGASRLALREGEMPAAMLRVSKQAEIGSDERALRVVSLTTGATIAASSIPEQEFVRGAMALLPKHASVSVRCSTGGCVFLVERLPGTDPPVELAVAPRAEWSDAATHGRLDPLGAGSFHGSHSHDYELAVVTLTGFLTYETDSGFKDLPPLSYAHFAHGAPHAVACKSAIPCERYIVETQ